MNADLKTQTMPTVDQVKTALEAVHDPHVPVSLRRMGMLREVKVGDDGIVRVQVCIPCMGCPGVSMLRADIRDAVMALDGVRDVVVEEGWHLPWSRDMIDAEASDLMRANGIQL